MPTISEELFERYCALRGFVLSPIKVAFGIRTPDFRLHAAAQEVICEIKQLEPNEEDLALREVLQRTGSVEYTSEMGKRARATIRSAKEQLKRSIGEQKPALLVVYDTTYLGHFDQHHIESGMFGVRSYAFRPGVTEVVKVRSEGREFSDELKTYISAVAVLELKQGDPRLIVYHNPFADRPIPESLFSDSRDENVFYKTG